MNGAGSAAASAVGGGATRSARATRRIAPREGSRGRLDQFREFLRRGERRVRGGVVVADPRHEAVEPLIAFGGLLHVDELRHLSRRQPVLVLEAGDLLTGRDPAVLLPVDADEHVALLEVGPVQLPRRVRPRPSSNITGASRSRSIAPRAARRSGSSSRRVELTKTREPLVGRPDHWRARTGRSRRGRRPARAPRPVPHGAILGRRAPVRPVRDGCRCDSCGRDRRARRLQVGTAAAAAYALGDETREFGGADRT